MGIVRGKASRHMDILDYVIQFIAAAIGTWGFSAVFSTPKKEYFFCALNGGIIWITYLLLKDAGVGLTMSCMGSTFVITILARAFSAIRKNPVTVFLITAIFPLVPGAGIYYTAYYLIMNDVAMAALKGMETFKVVGGMVLGIVFGFFMPKVIFDILAKHGPKREDGRYQKLV